MDRNTAIKLLCDGRIIYSDDLSQKEIDEYNEAVDMAIEALSAERTGEWIEIPHSEFWKCSCCGDADFPRDFCPNCGAKMEV